MSLSRLARGFLAVILLAAWQAALQHPIEHVDKLGELIHVHDGRSHPGSDSQPLCDLLDSLTACAPDAPFLAGGAEAFAPVSPTTPGRAPRTADAPPFFSQGPPASV